MTDVHTKLKVIKLAKNPFKLSIFTWFLYSEKAWIPKGENSIKYSFRLRDYINTNYKKDKPIVYNADNKLSPKDIKDFILTEHTIEPGESESLDNVIYWRNYLTKLSYLVPRETVQHSYRPSDCEWNLIWKTIDKFRAFGFYLIDFPEIYLSFEKPPAFLKGPDPEGLTLDIYYTITEKTLTKINLPVNYNVLREYMNKKYTERHLRSTLKDLKLSDEISFLLLKHADKEIYELNIREDISIENLLGLYKSNDANSNNYFRKLYKGTIILFDRGLSWSAKNHNFDKVLLQSIVLIHEFAHWITHLLPHKKSREWILHEFDNTEENVKEGLAELITWWIVNNEGGELKQIFEELNKCQSYPYKVYEHFISYEIDKIMDSLIFMRNLKKPSVLKDWQLFMENMVFIPGSIIKNKENGNEYHLESFYINKYEVTNEEYCNFLNSLNKSKYWSVNGLIYGEIYCGGSSEWIRISDKETCGITESSTENKFNVKPGYEQRPVLHVTPEGAKAYCKWLNDKYNIRRDGFRLPTNIEWEYACQAGSKKKYYWGDKIDGDYCWDGENAGEIHQNVGGKKPNKYGLYDMIGNVYEWCESHQYIHYIHFKDVHNVPIKYNNREYYIKGGFYEEIYEEQKAPGECLFLSDDEVEKISRVGTMPGKDNITEEMFFYVQTLFPGGFRVAFSK